MVILLDRTTDILYMNEPSALHNVFIARQPIYDRKLHVHAYELLLRDSKDNVANFADADQATTQLIVNTFIEIGLEQVVGKHHAFINLTRNFILGQYPLPIDPSQVTLEILDNIHIDKEIVSAVAKFSAAGYKIALTDFTFNKEAIPLLELADIIKIDLHKVKESNLPSYVQQVRMYPARLLAESSKHRKNTNSVRKSALITSRAIFSVNPALSRHNVFLPIVSPC